jgi:hypothetical protein
MIFCGQCGFLLPPGAAVCPRCGAPTPYNRSAEATNADDATVVTHPEAYQDDATPHTPIMGSQAPATPAFHDTSDPGHPSPPISYGGNYPPGASYPGFAPPPGAGYTTPATGSGGKGGPALKLAILIVLLLVLAILALFVVQPGRLQSFLGGHTVATPTPQPTSAPSTPTAQPSRTPVLTPVQEAQAVITQYYTDINNKDYHAAYNLWANYPQSYDTFAQGFAHTRHDDIGFGNSTQQSDGTVRVPIVITATSDAASATGTQQNQYQGYYIVGQQPDGSWKIITANIQAA